MASFTAYGETSEIEQQKLVLRYNILIVLFLQQTLTKPVVNVGLP